jgi:hypothetical protein
VEEQWVDRGGADHVRRADHAQQPGQRLVVGVQRDGGYLGRGVGQSGEYLPGTDLDEQVDVLGGELDRLGEQHRLGDLPAQQGDQVGVGAQRLTDHSGHDPAPQRREPFAGQRLRERTGGRCDQR